MPNLTGLTLEQAVARLPAKMEILSDEIGDKPPTPEKALTIFAQTVFGVGIAAVWLHEKLHAGQLWGSVLIVAGLVLGLSRQVKRTA